jgi:HAMP domain-containing protein
MAVPTTEIERQVNVIRGKILVSTTLAFLPAVAIAALFSRWVSRRFATIMSHATQLAQGNFRARLASPTQGEFGLLACEFLDLALQHGPLVAARLVLPDRLVDRHRSPGDGVHHDRSWRSSRVLRIPVSLHDLPGWDHSAR